jgi:hypothetical protein
VQQVSKQGLGFDRSAVGNVPPHWGAVLAVDTQVAEASDFPALREPVWFGLCDIGSVDNGKP